MITNHVKKTRSSHSKKDMIKSEVAKIIKSQPQTSKFSTGKQIKFLSTNQQITQDNKTTMKKKLMQILGVKTQPKYDLSEVQIGSKIYRVSPKSTLNTQKGLTSGYCISVGNLIVQSKSQNNFKSNSQCLNSQSIQAPKNNISDNRPLIKQIKIQSTNKLDQKQNLSSLLNVLNHNKQPQQKCSEELKYINSYIEKNSLEINKQFTTFVDSFDKNELQSQNLKKNKSETLVKQLLSERSTLLNVFKKLSRIDRQEQNNRQPLAYKRQRPPVLEQFSSMRKKSIQASFVDNNQKPQNEEDMNFLSQKNSVIQDIPLTQMQQQKTFSSSSSAPLFNVLSYLNPNSSSTNIQQQNLSSIQYSSNCLKKSDDPLSKVLERVKLVLIKSKHKEQRLLAERDLLKDQVLFWKTKHLEHLISVINLNKLNQSLVIKFECKNK